jgi:hypothetical protein
MNNLIRREEAAEAKVEIVSPDASIFTASWCSIQVIQRKLIVHTSDPTKLAPLRDLVVGLFQVLEHTPVEAFGLNRDRHFRMATEEEWHALGHFLAPKQPWAGVIQNPGLRTLRIEGRHDPNGTDVVRVKVEPSSQVTPNGLYLNIHRHYPVKSDDDAGPTAARLCNLLEASWQRFLAESEAISVGLLRQFDEAQRA